MLPYKRVWRAGVILFIILLYPAMGLCSVEMDPYLRRTLLAYVDLEYDNDYFNQGPTKTNFSSFVQTYGLTFRGNILSRRLIIYDLGVSLIDDKISETTQGAKTTYDYKDIDYNLRTTLLPLSAIPLTLYGDKFDTFTNGQKFTDTTYGLTWLERIRTLPTTEVNYQKSAVKAAGTDDEVTDATVSLMKKLGPTLNSLYYMYLSTNDKVHDLSQSQNTFSFNNRTNISRSTDFFITGTRSVEDATGAIGSTLTGVSMGLNSKTSRDLSQNHSYNYYNNSTGDLIQKGQNYLGSINFTPSSAFSTRLQLAADDYVNGSPVNTSTENDMNTSGSLDYHITDRLLFDSSALNDTSRMDFEGTGVPSTGSKGGVTRTDNSLTYLITDHIYTSEVMSYNDIQAQFLGQPLMTYSLLTEVTNIGYRNDYDKWLRYWSAAGAGFADERFDGESQTGAVDDIDLGISAAPDFSRYVGVKGEVAYKRMEKLTDGLLVNDKNEHYHFEMFNKYDKEYAVATISYDRSTISSIWLNTLAAPLLISGGFAPIAPVNITAPRIQLNAVYDQMTEVYTASLMTNYFRGSSIYASANHTNSFNPIVGSEHADTEYIMATYGRPLWKGMLQGTASYANMNYTTSEQFTSTSYQALLNATYSRELLHNLGWQVLGQYINQKADIIKSQSYMAQNSLNYNLREWYLTVAHTYTLTQTTGAPSSTDNSVFFRVTRTFVRYF